MDKKDINEKKFLIVGLARSGRASAEALRKLGASVDVYDIKGDDEKYKWAVKIGCKAIFNEDPQAPYDVLVLSPGVNPNQGFIKAYKDRGSEIIGELELAYILGKGKYIGITGTNGKTTTTTLVGEIFSAQGRKTKVVGNIGTAALTCAMDVDDDTYMVTECSSFQLETVKKFRPEVSAILNITPDHLDRHGNMENYMMAKANIFSCQTKSDYFVYNEDDPLCVKVKASCKATAVPFSRKKKLDYGAYVDEDIILINDGNVVHPILKVSELKIPGLHNLENALAASAICYFSGIDIKVIKEVLKSFKGVEHRLESVGEIDGVHYVNDSKGTNPDATLKAVDAFKSIILIAGGYDKGADFDKFIAGFNDHVKAMVIMGVTADKLENSAKKVGFSPVYRVGDMKEAVNCCKKIAKSGDIVLLSPACASWDMYKCFEDRGNDFKTCVKNIKNL